MPNTTSKRNNLYKMVVKIQWDTYLTTVLYKLFPLSFNFNIHNTFNLDANLLATNEILRRNSP